MAAETGLHSGTRRTLAGRRVVVVGGSSGIGRAIAARAVAEGATVVAAARRKERLDALVEAAGGGLAVPCDVSTGEGRTTLADAVAGQLGGVDLLVVTIGLAPLAFLDEASDDDWSATLATNVVAVNGVIRTLLPHCDDGAIIAVLSSETVSQERTGLGIYSASKAAVDQALVVWRAERPDVRFTRVVVGSTIDTEFGARFDGELLGWALENWKRRGLLPAAYLMSDDVAEAVVGALASAWSLRDVSLDSMTVRPAAAPEGELPRPGAGR